MAREKWEDVEFGKLSEGAQWLGNLQQGISNENKDVFNWAMSKINSESNLHDWFRESAGGNELFGMFNSNFGTIAKNDELKTNVGKLIGSISGDSDWKRYNKWFDELNTYNQKISGMKKDISLGITKAPVVGSGLTENMGNFLRENSAVQTYKRKLENINRMKEVYLDGIDREAAKSAYLGRQNILNTQRKYGLTGGAVDVMMKQFELQQSAKHIEMRNKAMMDFEKQYGGSRIRLESEQELGRAAAINAVKHQAQTGKYTPDQMRNTLSTQGIDVSGLTDEDLNSFIMNPNSI